MKNEENEKKLTKTQQKVLDKLEEYEYDIELATLANELGTSATSLSNIITRIEAKGYKVREKMKMSKKGYKPENIILSNEQSFILDIYEKIDSEVNKILRKFSEFDFVRKDAIRISKIIKLRNKSQYVLDNIISNKDVAYDNISILIDELLQNPEEDRTKAIDFVIAYEEILLSRGLERVEEPIYQLLDKHKVQLTKGQCNRVMNLLNAYEEKIKPEQAEEEELEL